MQLTYRLLITQMANNRLLLKVKIRLGLAE